MGEGGKDTKKEIPKALDELDHATEGICKVVEILGDRLAPAMIPIEATTKKEEGMEPGCNVSDRIFNNVKVLNLKADIIAEYLDKLQI